MLKSCAVLGTVVILSGCAASNYAINREPIPFKAFPDQGDAAIYLWPPYTSAAIVDKQGNRCVLAASGAQTVDANSEAALKAGDLFGKVANLDASTKDKIVEAFKQISQPDSRAAALDVALFHLCMLDQNGTFKDANMGAGAKGPLILQAYRETVREALKPNAASTPATSAAAPTNR